MVEEFKNFIIDNDSSKEFNFISTYLHQAFIPEITELDAYMKEKLNNDNFTIWGFLRQLSMKSLNDDGFFINGLNQFFMQFNISNFEEFLHNKTGQVIFKIIKENYENIRITRDLLNPESIQNIKFTHDFDVIYYYNSGTYNSYDLRHFANRCSQLNDDILKIRKIEIIKNNQWLPLVIFENNKHFLCKEI